MFQLILSALQLAFSMPHCYPHSPVIEKGTLYPENTHPSPTWTPLGSLRTRAQQMRRTEQASIMEQ